MLWSFYVLLAATLAFGSGCKRKADDPMIGWKRLDELPTFAIELAPGAAESLRQHPKDWVKATFRHGDKVFEEVGVRLKGHRSMRKLDDKPAIKVRFDKYRKGVRFRGVSRLTLNNMVEDPTMLREVLGYRLYRELGVQAPAAFYARIEIDGADYGLYAVIETIDDDFLKARFGDATGGLYEGEYGCDLYVDDIDGFDRDGGDKEATRKDLRAFAEAADGDEHALFSRTGPIDMDSFLAYLAVSAFIGDFDGYRHAHNYRIYHEPTKDKWFFLPWGIDRAFIKDLSIYESFGRLARMCFANAKCRAEYVRVQRDVVRAFGGLKLEEGAAALAAFIEPTLQSAAKTPSGAKINKEREELVTYLRERPAAINNETRCLDESGAEIDGDGDGFGCLDCDDASASTHPGAAEICDGVDNDCTGQADDSPSCPTCPVHEIEGRRYALCKLPRPWTEARAYCQGLGGELASIDSEAANEAIAAAISKILRERWWISLNDRASEGEFVSARPAAYSNWAKTEPDNNSCNQDCAVIDARRRGSWHDTHCGEFAPFVCELP